jgi:hypothetical protein
VTEVEIRAWVVEHGLAGRQELTFGACCIPAIVPNLRKVTVRREPTFWVLSVVQIVDKVAKGDFRPPFVAAFEQGLRQEEVEINGATSAGNQSTKGANCRV